MVYHAHRQRYAFSCGYLTWLVSHGTQGMYGYNNAGLIKVHLYIHVGLGKARATYQLPLLLFLFLTAKHATMMMTGITATRRIITVPIIAKSVVVTAVESVSGTAAA